MSTLVSKTGSGHVCVRAFMCVCVIVIVIVLCAGACLYYSPCKHSCAPSLGKVGIVSCMKS